jgi:hypothetical protein
VAAFTGGAFGAILLDDGLYQATGNPFAFEVAASPLLGTLYMNWYNSMPSDDPSDQISFARAVSQKAQGQIDAAMGRIAELNTVMERQQFVWNLPGFPVDEKHRILREIFELNERIKRLKKLKELAETAAAAESARAASER